MEHTITHKDEKIEELTEDLDTCKVDKKECEDDLAATSAELLDTKVALSQCN